MSKPKTMVTQVKEYIAYRRMLGFQLRSEGAQLLNFAKYADRMGHTEPVTTELMVRWARLPQKSPSSYHAYRIQIVRCFAKYQSVFFPKAQIPPSGILGPCYRRKEPYIYPQEHISALLKACTQLAPIDGIRPRTYATLFGLIACTGLRVSEALMLSRKDVDLTNGTLLISESKFHKSRLVPLHPSASRMLGKYAKFRDYYHPIAASDKFFLSETGRALPYTTVRQTFQSLRKHLGWRAKNNRLPRIHDMRHTFACRRLLLWYEQGIDINHAIYSLSTYLGHVQIKDTYWYLTGIPELFAVIVKLFEKFTLKHNRRSIP